jgi:GNAT superfamily N-acetyltransferase
MPVAIRPATAGDHDAIWRVMEPIIRAGETYSLPRDMNRDEALAHWFALDRSVFVAEDGGEVIGTYYLRANRPGPGAHVSNAGFMVSDKTGGKGVGAALCEHALATAKARGFAAMVAANDRAVRLWQRKGFAEIGRTPDAFQYPRLGLVDALVMYRKL